MPRRELQTTSEALPDQLDFFANPKAKDRLRMFRKRLNELPEDQQYWKLDNYAFKTGALKVPRDTHSMKVYNIPPDGFGMRLGHKSPHHVMQAVEPGYSFLLNAYKWLLKLEEQDQKIDTNRQINYEF